MAATLSTEPKRISAAQTSPFELSPKLAGRSKADFELVVARYDEDIHWMDNYDAFRTVYNKGLEM